MFHVVSHEMKPYEPTVINKETSTISDRGSAEKQAVSETTSTDKQAVSEMTSTDKQASCPTLTSKKHASSATASATQQQQNLRERAADIPLADGQSPDCAHSTQ